MELKKGIYQVAPGAEEGKQLLRTEQWVAFTDTLFPSYLTGKERFQVSSTFPAY